MIIHATQKLLNSDVTNYNFMEEWNKFTLSSEKKQSYPLAAFMGCCSIIPVILSFSGFRMCPKGGAEMGPYVSNPMGIFALAINGIFFAQAFYQKCALKYYKFSILSSDKTRIKRLKKWQFASDLGMGIFGTMIAVNLIYLITLNLYCKNQ